MRSIRLSLTAYFSALVVLGMGGVSALTYQTTAITLYEKEESARSLIDNEIRDRRKEARDDFDQHLRERTRQFILRHSERGRTDSLNSLNPLTMFGGPFTPLAHLTTTAQARLSIALTFFRMAPRPLDTLMPLMPNPDEFLGEEPAESPAAEFALTRYASGKVWERTSNLPPKTFSLPEGYRELKGLNDAIFDEIDISGVPVRVLMMKVPRFFVPSPVPPRPLTAMTRPEPGPGAGTKTGAAPKRNFGNGFRGSAWPNVPPQTPFKGFDPSFYVQYGIEMTALQQELHHLNEERTTRLDRLGEETQTALASLRRRLVLLSVVTLTGVLLGSFVLVWLGLLPLHRLSHAVSQVSEKDFQLKIERSSLPAELQPIARRVAETLRLLQKAFAREKQAAEDISHDLRTPLAALNTTLEVALKKERKPAEYRELLQECQLSAHQMSHLVERLLALARIDAGSNPVNLRDIDLSRVVHIASDLVRPLAKVQDVTLRVHAPDQLPVRADGDKIHEVLTNLLHNAIDYNRPGGSIDLTVRRDGATVELNVADTGIGIRPEAREHLFERFYRADPSRHVETPHCGLGLAIVKSYVELLGGEISVDSEVGCGTTFRIVFPYAAPSATAIVPRRGEAVA